MEKLRGILGHFGGVRGCDAAPPAETAPTTDKENNAFRRFIEFVERLLLWDNTTNSIVAFSTFSIVFWGLTLLSYCDTVAGCIALVMALCCAALETQTKSQCDPATWMASSPNKDKLHKIVDRVTRMNGNLKMLRRNHRGLFCVGACMISGLLWLLSTVVPGEVMVYSFLMAVLLAPVLMLQLPENLLPRKAECDNEIDDFLPVVTEDNFAVLKRAGETGDHSPPPLSEVSVTPTDLFNEYDFSGLNMSYDNGSTVEVELSEIELSSEGDCTENSEMTAQTSCFEQNSSTSGDDEEADIELKDQNISSESDDSENDFEIIDSREISDINNL